MSTFTDPSVVFGGGLTAFDRAFRDEAEDAATYIAVAAALIAIATVAGYAPIRNAGAPNPAEALVNWPGRRAPQQDRHL